MLKERKFRRRLCTSSVQREIRHFHVVVVQWRQRNLQKKLDARGKLLFCQLNLLLLWRSHCRRRCRILRSLFRQLKQQRRLQLPKRHLKSEVALLETLSRLIHLVQFVKCWQIFWSWIVQDCIKVQEKKRKVVVVWSRTWDGKASYCELWCGRWRVSGLKK